MYLVYDSSHGEAAAIQAAIAESKAAVSCVDLADRDSFQRREVTEEILEQGLQLASSSSCSERAAAKAHLMDMLLDCPCWFCTPDGVAGPVETRPESVGTTVALLLREAAYHCSLRRLPARELEAGLESLTICAPGVNLAILCGQAAALLELHGAVVVRNFLGEAHAVELAETDFGSLSPACPGNGSGSSGPTLGSGRGDWVVLPSEAPDRFLSSLDAFVAGLRPLVRGKMDTCEFRTWPMVTVYEPGRRYTWHLDNGKCGNGRLLTCIYYLNQDWPHESGGDLRLLRQESPDELQIMAEVPPLLDTLVIFWSESVPHEVLPPWTGLRHAMSVWYLCPLHGLEHFSAGNAHPAFGQSVSSAVESIREALEVGASAPATTMDVLDQLVELADATPQEITPRHAATE